jgi:hypothetical protein
MGDVAYDITLEGVPDAPSGYTKKVVLPWEKVLMRDLGAKVNTWFRFNRDPTLRYAEMRNGIAHVKNLVCADETSGKALARAYGNDAGLLTLSDDALDGKPGLVMPGGDYGMRFLNAALMACSRSKGTFLWVGKPTSEDNAAWVGAPEFATATSGNLGPTMGYNDSGVAPSLKKAVPYFWDNFGNQKVFYNTLDLFNVVHIMMMTYSNTAGVRIAINGVQVAAQPSVTGLFEVGQFQLLRAIWAGAATRCAKGVIGEFIQIDDDLLESGYASTRSTVTSGLVTMHGVPL